MGIICKWETLTDKSLQRFENGDFSLLLTDLKDITEEHCEIIANYLGENPKYIAACFRGQPEYNKPQDASKVAYFLSITNVHAIFVCLGYAVHQLCIENGKVVKYTIADCVRENIFKIKE